MIRVVRDLTALAWLVLAMTGCREAPSARPSVVLVVIDTVRTDFTGLGAGESHTPFLDRLAGEATRFDDCWAVAPWTVPSHASIFTGALPAEHGCTMRNVRFEWPAPALAEILSRHGYDTAAFFANPWLSDEATGLLRGFSVRTESPWAGFRNRPPGRGGYQGGRAVLSRVSEFLDSRGSERPLFLFVNLLEPHLPYDPPPAYRERELPGLPPGDVVSIDWATEFNAGLHPPSAVDWSRVRALYGGDVSTVDALLESLVKLLGEHGLGEEAVLIVTSDHGENLGDHRLMEHQYSVHETLLSVPLVIRAPGRLAPGPRGEPVLLTDLFATVLDCAGVTGVDLPRHSRSLLRREAPAGGRERPLPAEYAGPHPALLGLLRMTNPDLDDRLLRRGYRTVRLGSLRLTVAEDGAVELHDLASDPAQERNLAADRPRDVAALRAILDREVPAPGADAREPLELDEETREKLRSLGYVE